jgi:hypothetical protein
MKTLIKKNCTSKVVWAPRFMKVTKLKEEYGFQPLVGNFWVSSTLRNKWFGNMRLDI